MDFVLQERVHGHINGYALFQHQKVGSLLSIKPWHVLQIVAANIVVILASLSKRFE